MATDNEKVHAEALKRSEIARSFWQYNHEQARIDLRLMSPDQWDPHIKKIRDTNGIPCLSFNSVAPMVSQITNRARQQRPQPKVSPSDKQASAAVAEVLEGHMRHIQYISQADVAYDGAVESSAACGFGFYQYTTEYTSEDSFTQEPRVRRILNPMSILFQPRCKEPDYSDAKWCFETDIWVTRDEFKEMFPGEDPMDFDSGESDWTRGKEDGDVCLAKYWCVKTSKREKVALITGIAGYRDDIEEQLERELTPDEIVKTRDSEEREVWCHLMDGQKILESTQWLGKWIPIVPVLGKEWIDDQGRYILSSVIRNARDAVQLVNAGKSGIAFKVGLSQKPQLNGYLGVKGSMKGPEWTNIVHLEYEPIDINGKPALPPIRQGMEVDVAVMSQMVLAEQDDIRRTVGYTDNVINPAQGDLSGVAVKRRQAQADLTNFHFEDNLERSQFHGARILLDLICKLYDVPMEIATRKADGSTGIALTTQANEDGDIPLLQGKEHEEHMRLDVGRYDVIISSEPSYDSKLESEKDLLTQIMEANPQMMSIAGDIFFKLLGYPDLEERAKYALLPPIQQAIQEKENGGKPDPAALQQQLMQAQAQNQAVMQQLQQLLLERKAKLIEGQTRIEVATINRDSKIAEVRLEGQNAERKQANEHIHEHLSQKADHQHDATSTMFTEELGAVKHMLDLIQKSETAPDPEQQHQHAMELAKAKPKPMKGL